MPSPTTSEPRPATIGELSPLRVRKTSEPAATRRPPARSTARTPNRLRPERTPTVAPTGHPSTIAESAKPPISGDFCITPCTNTGRNVREPDHHHADQKRGGVGRGDRPASPKLQRNHRLRRSALLQDEQHDRNHRDQGGEPDFEPARGRKRGQIGHDGGDGDGEYAGAQMVYSAAAADALFVQIGPEPCRSERANRQIHPEDPGPGKILDDERAGERSEDRRQRPHTGQPALDLRPLMRRIEVADDGHGGRLNRARADALNQPEDNQRRHRPCESA